MKQIFINWLRQALINLITSPEFIELLSNLLSNHSKKSKNE